MADYYFQILSNIYHLDLITPSLDTRNLTPNLACDFVLFLFICYYNIVKIKFHLSAKKEYKLHFSNRTISLILVGFNVIILFLWWKSVVIVGK